MPETCNVSVMYNAYSWVYLSPHPSIINEALLGHIDTAQGRSPVTKRSQKGHDQRYRSHLTACLPANVYTQNLPLVFKSLPTSAEPGFREGTVAPPCLCPAPPPPLIISE